MKTKKFSISEAISFGWNAMKKNLGFFIVLLIVGFLIYTVPEIIESVVSEYSSLMAIIIRIFSVVLSQMVLIGFIKIALKIHDGEKPEISDLLAHSSPVLINFVMGGILYGLIVFFGFFLLIIPGVIWSIKYLFYNYLIVEHNLTPRTALKKSAELTAGSKWDLFFLSIVFALINLAGMLFLLIGLFATIPTTMVATAYVYRKLSEQPAPAESSEMNASNQVPNQQELLQDQQEQFVQ